MSAQRLSDRSKRRIERTTGLEVVRAWSHGDYWMSFVTPEHRHGLWHRHTHEVRWVENPIHYTSCDELFPAVDDYIRRKRA